MYFYIVEGKIRIAFITDIEKIMEVADATWKQTYAPIISKEQIEFMYERSYSYDALKVQMQNGTTFLIYVEEDKTLGFAAYQFKDDNIIFIPKIYIKPEEQRKNVGKKLLKEIEKIAAKNNCPYVELNVNRKNNAIYFYKKMGFELHEKVDIAYGKFWLNDYVLRKSMVNSQ
ncbi:MAG: acetyltransferase [Bacteroidota bacterium]|nr:acetyltransferase [Bacteroidota bacterium]